MLCLHNWMSFDFFSRKGLVSESTASFALVPQFFKATHVQPMAGLSVFLTNGRPVFKNPNWKQVILFVNLFGATRGTQHLTSNERWASTQHKLIQLEAVRLITDALAFRDGLLHKSPRRCSQRRKIDRQQRLRLSLLTASNYFNTSPTLRATASITEGSENQRNVLESTWQKGKTSLKSLALMRFEI